MTQQYQTLKYEMPRLHATVVPQKQINKNCFKTLKPLLSKGCGRGEIGKHKGLKIPRPYGLVGSSPTARTIKRSCRAFDLPEEVSRQCVVVAPVTHLYPGGNQRALPA